MSTGRKERSTVKNTHVTTHENERNASLTAFTGTVPDTGHAKVVNVPLLTQELNMTLGG